MQPTLGLQLDEKRERSYFPVNFAIFLRSKRLLLYQYYNNLLNPNYSYLKLHTINFNLVTFDLSLVTLLSANMTLLDLFGWIASK